MWKAVDGIFLPLPFTFFFRLRNKYYMLNHANIVNRNSDFAAHQEALKREIERLRQVYHRQQQQQQIINKDTENRGDSRPPPPQPSENNSSPA